jgi:hypothetical protein
VSDLGTSGTRPGDSAMRLRTLPSKVPPAWGATQRARAGRGARDLTHTGHGGGVVAPSLPTKAGDRVPTARRDTLPLARLRRAGARSRRWRVSGTRSFDARGGFLVPP